MYIYLCVCVDNGAFSSSKDILYERTYIYIDIHR